MRFAVGTLFVRVDVPCWPIQVKQNVHVADMRNFCCRRFPRVLEGLAGC